MPFVVRPARAPRPVSLLCLVAALLLAACGGTRPAAEPPPLRLTIYGTATMNSAADGEGANAAVVRLYQLTGPTNFTEATPDAFWRDDEAALGDELVDAQQVLLYPDQQEVVTLEPAETARYVGVAVDLRRPDPGAWRQVYAVEALRGRAVRVEVGATQVRVFVE